MLTKREAITKCKEQWLWVAEDPTRDKEDYPPAKYMKCSCFCCQYNVENASNFCGKNCLLDWRNGGYCVLGEYDDWRDAFYIDNDYPATKAAALSIVALCDKALIELDKEGGK